MIKKFTLLFLILFSAVFAEKDEQLIIVHGIGKMMVKADLADIKLGIEVEEKTASEVEVSLASRLPKLIDILREENIDKLETGMVEIHPEYSQSSPPEIKHYRGRTILSFTVPAKLAGKMISNAFATGANVLTQVKVRASDASIEQARAIVLKEASHNALSEAELVLDALNLRIKEISSITVMPSDSGVPIYRNTEFAMLANKNLPEMTVLEGEQMVQAQIEMNIIFRAR